MAENTEKNLAEVLVKLAVEQYGLTVGVDGLDAVIEDLESYVEASHRTTRALEETLEKVRALRAS